ncbi:MAG TPA: HAD family hydrolase [Fibrobacteria bacterium]|nr:HAD family hydrolase [Fibrobacteria bacterium]HOX50610.1 HAD family hydrolase [Fibrobacteria bacterium]
METFASVPRPRLVAFDLDGTLLRSDKTTSERTRKALRGMLAKGVELAVATARSPLMIGKLVPPELKDAVWIAHNGAQVLHGGAEFHRCFLERGILPEVAGLALEFSPTPLLCVELDGALYSNRDVTHLWGPGFQVVPFQDLPDGTPPKILAGLEDCPGFAEALLRTLGPRAQIDVTDAGLYAQIHAPRVAKHHALDEWIRHRGISWSEVSAFGDDVTDEGMLRLAGWGVAMGNAPERVQAAAKFTTATSDDDGVARFLERWTQ